MLSANPKYENMDTNEFIHFKHDRVKDLETMYTIAIQLMDVKYRTYLNDNGSWMYLLCDLL